MINNNKELASQSTSSRSLKKSNQRQKSGVEVRHFSDDGENEVDAAFMRQAMLLAKKAQAIGEVPVGAIIVVDSIIVGQGYNQSIALHDPSAHAEMLALREAARNLENYRVLDATLYVTLEPCPMCAGAMVHGRVKRIVFGAYDQKTGAAGTTMNLVQHDTLNHKMEVTGGCLQDECGAQISAFFKQRRKQKKG
ncbi:MAG: tRNA(adenine34) deaminase [Bermanella sp.]|jgi:tRNA(adenine34) deaminase|uniref:tRNA adenosine(34) deaminase TadA n=1 Tax=Glaciecola sp. 33A TaxID=2057807 RepID=UPI000C33E237|nr:tRNA adenosine(34) deaminase TadA [Glaciecola sp. 33A]PKI02662.1 tRNA adenosine(34) deaminase TadA [Glaciecola sp. 33A]